MTWLYLVMNKDDEQVKNIPEDFMVSSLIDFCCLVAVIVAVMAGTG